MRSRALLIGINDYYESFRSLKGAIADVTDIETWLMGQGVNPIDKHISRGNEDVYSATPQGSEINNWLNRLDSEAGVIKAENGGAMPDFPLGDRLYVFYSGHGIDASTAGPAAVFPQTRDEYWDLFPIEPLKRHLQNSGYFREIVMVFDACRESLDYAFDPTWARKMKVSPNSDQVQVATFYPRGSSQPTPEVDFGGGKIRGVLCHAFLQGVSGLAAEGGQVTATRLKDFVENAIRDKVPLADPSIAVPRSPMIITQVQQTQPVIKIECSAISVGNAILKHNAGGEHPIQLNIGANAYEVPMGSYVLKLNNGTEKEINAIWEVNDVAV